MRLFSSTEKHSTFAHGLATFTRIDGDESCTSRVVEELGMNE
jgi:hypothetical protein